MNQIISTDKQLNLIPTKPLALVSRRRKELKIYLKSLFGTNSPTKKFLIFSQGRTGSTLLCDLLKSHPQIHCDQEIFYSHVFLPNFYLNGKLKNSSKDIYGFKVKIYQLSKKQKIKNPKQFIHNLSEDGWKIIYLKRDNLLRHSLSNIVALNRQQYHIFKNNYQDSQAKPKINVDFNLLLEIMNNREKFLAEEARVLQDIPHITITYENDLLRQEQHQNTLNNIFDFLDIDSYSIGTNLVKIVPDNLELIIENYEDLITKISKSQYNYFLH